MRGMIYDAWAFASEHHTGQERKFTKEPYVTHLEETARLLWEAKNEAASEEYAAAILHDVVEDTPITLEEVGREFGAYVMSLVGELTANVELKKQMGKKPYMTMAVNAMTSKAFTIKLCDRLHNISGLLDRRTPKSFVKWYWVETNYILDNLNRNINNEQERLIHRMRTTLYSIKKERLGG